MQKLDLNGKTTIAIIATTLTGLLALGGILGWKIDAATMAQAQTIKKECDENYVLKKIYEKDIEYLSKNIEAISRAVGARIKNK